MNKIIDRFKHIGRFFYWVGSQFYHNHGFTRASALTFASLLAMVPFFVVGFAILS